LPDFIDSARPLNVSSGGSCIRRQGAEQGRPFDCRIFRSEVIHFSRFKLEMKMLKDVTLNPQGHQTAAGGPEF
jgi:hypothetical protein